MPLDPVAPPSPLSAYKGPLAATSLEPLDIRTPPPSRRRLAPAIIWRYPPSSSSPDPEARRISPPCPFVEELPPDISTLPPSNRLPVVAPAWSNIKPPALSPRRVPVTSLISPLEPRSPFPVRIDTAPLFPFEDVPVTKDTIPESAPAPPDAIVIVPLGPFELAPESKDALPVAPAAETPDAIVTIPESPSTDVPVIADI